jgi:hypothetical protein
MRSCFFLHNPKAGGTALFQALARHYDSRDIAPWVDQLPELYGPEATPPLPEGFRFYAGHYGYDHYRSVCDGHLPVTNFRHPATRLKSLYSYFRLAVARDAASETLPEFHAVRFARSVSFEDFVGSEDPRILTYTSDHHFRQLANSGWRLRVERSFDEVCAFIDAMPWFYVCEYPVLSIRWARAAMGAPDFAVTLANVSPDQPAESRHTLGISEEAFSRILEINPHDLAIYGHAVGRFFVEVGPVVGARTRTGPAPSRRSAPIVPLGGSL